MMVLLTDEEIAQVIFQCNGTVKDARREVNKAQLKNVVEGIKRNSYVALDKRTGEVKLGSVIIDPEFWQALLKEIDN